MPDKAALGLLSAMITPAVLISACGTLIFSTSTRLSRIVDRAQRGRLIQRSLTSLYVSLGLFVAATVGIALTSFFPRTDWIHTALGVAGTLVLFYGCVLLIRETQLALRSVDSEMEFMLRLPQLYRSQDVAARRE